MKLIADSLVLAIAGSWNPAIITPNWVARYVLGYPPEKQFDVSIEFPVDGMFARTPKVDFEGLALQVTLRRLTLALSATDSDRNDKTLKVAAKILDLLKHTPVSGVGLNLSFLVSDASGPILKSFGASADVARFVEDENALVVSNQWGSSVKVADRVLNVNCISEAGTVRIAFNVHHEVASAEAAGALLSRAGLYDTIYSEAVRVASGICGETLEGS